VQIKSTEEFDVRIISGKGRYNIAVNILPFFPF
jgi:hypothetical protein